ncbi:hypothetical protein AVEN_271489-1 [Araneus ventricosus]|uniref:Uncharacterized protein n=1 Tax=Araneus ventricosus TaxID=182803 RepID=A0A4Y2JIP7_ARAVE|nr:hypothetical protein AVEN_271489-1 [Araneus ventricosus]
MEPLPYSPDLTPNLCSKHLSGTMFSSNNDVKTAAENWFNVQGRDFYQARLDKFLLGSDKYLNRFCDYVEKLPASIHLNTLSYFLSIVNK